MLSGRPFADAVTLVADHCAAIEASGEEMKMLHPLESISAAFSKKDFSTGATYNPHHVFGILFTGLSLFAAHESERTKTKGTGLVDGSVVERLNDIKHEGAAVLLNTLSVDEVLLPPTYTVAREHTVEQLGFAAGTKVYAGTGY